MKTLRVEHDPQADAAYVYLADDAETPVAETRELAPDSIFADYAADGSLVGIEFLAVSEGVHLDNVPHPREIALALRSKGIMVLQGVA